MVDKGVPPTPALKLPRLRPDQWEIATSKASIRVVAMGRRWGKTTMAGSCAIAWAAAGGHVGWVAPMYKNTRPLWRMAESVVRPYEDIIRILRNDREIFFPGGGRLGMYSGDNPTAILGEAFDVIILDEAARIPEDVWTETIQPTLADRSGFAILISTPKGKNWFYHEFMRGYHKEPGYASWTAPSWNNPMPSIKAAAESARHRVSERTFRQEWMAEFLDDGGSVFSNVRKVAKAEVQERAIDGHVYLMGVDWGRITDRTVIVTLDVTTKSIARIDTFAKMDYERQLGRLRQIWEKFGRCMVYVEHNSIGGPLLEQLMRQGMPVRGFYTTGQSKPVIIDALALAFEREDIQIVNDPTLISELEAYESSTLPSGSVRYSAPAGKHDDYVMALAIAWHHMGRSSSAIGAFGAFAF